VVVTLNIGIGLLGILLASTLQAAGVGDRAPHLAKYKGQVVFVNFWASWCAPCLVELPELNRLAAHYKGRKVKVLAINVDADRAAARRTLARLKLSKASFEVLWDTKSKTITAYDPPTMPSSYLVDRQGRIRYLHPGFQAGDPATWRQEIDSLL